MSLTKNIVSDRTGTTLGYHEVSQAVVTPGFMAISVLSYPDKASKDAGRQPADALSLRVAYDGSVLSKGVLAWAQDQVLALPAFAGATVA
jgi:hypothetical protein